MTACRPLAFAALLAALGLGTAARAATLSGIQGQVLVNSGAGYMAATGVLELNPGDLVLAGPGASARLSFADGCVAALGAGAVVAISMQSPCVAQVQAQSQEGPPPAQDGGSGQPGSSAGSGGAGGSAGMTGDAGGAGLGGGTGLGGFSIAPAIAVGASVVGVTLGVVASVTNARRPASP